MSYAVDVLPEARRHLDRLPEKHLFAALEFIYGALSESPHRVGPHFGSSWKGSTQRAAVN